MIPAPVPNFLFAQRRTIANAPSPDALLNEDGTTLKNEDGSDLLNE